MELNSIRQCFTYFSSIIVFLFAGLIIKTKEDGSNQLTWDDCWSIQTLCYITSAIGAVASIFFQVFTPEKVTATNMLESTMVATIRYVRLRSNSDLVLVRTIFLSQSGLNDLASIELALFTL